MNIKNVDKLIKFVESETTDIVTLEDADRNLEENKIVFSMDRVLEHYTNESEYGEDYPCQTAACICGSAAILSGEFEIEEGLIPPTKTLWHIALNFLGISESCGNALFSPQPWNYKDFTVGLKHIRRIHAIHVLKKMREWQEAFGQIKPSLIYDAWEQSFRMYGFKS